MLDSDSHSGAPPKPLNREGLLERVMGDEELADELVQDFLSDSPAQIRLFNKLVAAADVTAAEHQAHFIKGAAAAVGADAIWDVALGLEKAAKNGDTEALVAGAPALEFELGRLREAVNAVE